MIRLRNGGLFLYLFDSQTIALGVIADVFYKVSVII